MPFSLTHITVWHQALSLMRAVELKLWKAWVGSNAPGILCPQIKCQAGRGRSWGMLRWARLSRAGLLGPPVYCLQLTVSLLTMVPPGGLMLYLDSGLTCCLLHTPASILSVLHASLQQGTNPLKSQPTSPRFTRASIWALNLGCLCLVLIMASIVPALPGEARTARFQLLYHPGPPRTGWSLQQL